MESALGFQTRRVFIGESDVQFELAVAIRQRCRIFGMTHRSSPLLTTRDELHVHVE